MTRAVAFPDHRKRCVHAHEGGLLRLVCGLEIEKREDLGAMQMMGLPGIHAKPLEQLGLDYETLAPDTILIKDRAK